MQANFRVRSQIGATEITQFPLTIYCLFLVLFLPVTNLIALVVAASTIYVATNDLAAKAAAQPTFAQSLNAMTLEAYSFQSNSLARFAKMVPNGGYTGCGNDLYVLATDMKGAGVQTSAPNQSLTSNVDTTKSIYEMQVVSSYSVSPLVSLASFPLLREVPGLGRPVLISFAAYRPIEHPGGMQLADESPATTAVTPFGRMKVSALQSMPQGNKATWRNPNIYQQIQAAGETIISENVLLVQANNPNWTATGVNVSPGQKVWVDTQAVGIWNSWPSSYSPIDANGYAGRLDAGAVCPSLVGGSLDGRVGTNGKAFLVGNNLYNYPLESGMFSLIMNDDVGGYGDNVGTQMVRIIVVD